MYINKIIVFSVLIFLASCTQGKSENSATVVKHVSATEFATLLNEGNGLLIDIRTPGEFNAGHIDGSKLINFYAPDFREKLTELDRDTPVYLYCRSGSRSGKTVRMMQGMGFEKVVNLHRGINDWMRSGLDLVN